MAPKADPRFTATRRDADNPGQDLFAEEGAAHHRHEDHRAAQEEAKRRSEDEVSGRAAEPRKDGQTGAHHDDGDPEQPLHGETLRQHAERHPSGDADSAHSGEEQGGHTRGEFFVDAKIDQVEQDDPGTNVHPNIRAEQQPQGPPAERDANDGPGRTPVAAVGPEPRPLPDSAP